MMVISSILRVITSALQSVCLVHAFIVTSPTYYFLDLNVCCLIFSGVFNGFGSPNRDHFSDTDLYVRCDSNPVRTTAWGMVSIKPSAIMTAAT